MVFDPVRPHPHCDPVMFNPFILPNSNAKMWGNMMIRWRAWIASQRCFAVKPLMLSDCLTRCLHSPFYTPQWIPEVSSILADFNVSPSYRICIPRICPRTFRKCIGLGFGALMLNKLWEKLHFSLEDFRRFPVSIFKGNLSPTRLIIPLFAPLHAYTPHVFLTFLELLYYYMHVCTVWF